MALVIDEQIATLLLVYLTGDAREGWTGWGRLCFVNKACAAVFRQHASQLLNYYYGNMYLRLKEQDRLLFLWMKNCTCRAFYRSDHPETGSDESGSETEFSEQDDPDAQGLLDY
jgi:hypothetical protein